MVYFKVDQSPYSKKGEWTIMSTEILTKHFPAKSAYSIIPSRVMGLSYPAYLRMCRDKYCARLTGKNHKYITPYFPEKSYAECLAKELNTRLTEIYKYTLRPQCNPE